MCAKFSKILSCTGKSSHWLRHQISTSPFECRWTHPSWKLNRYKSVSRILDGVDPILDPAHYHPRLRERSKSVKKKRGLTEVLLHQLIASLLSQALHPLAEASLPRKANLTGFCKQHMSQKSWVRKDSGQKKIAEQFSSLYRRRHRERVGFPFVACQSGAREAKVRGV